MSLTDKIDPKEQWTVVYYNHHKDWDVAKHSIDVPPISDSSYTLGDPFVSKEEALLAAGGLMMYRYLKDFVSQWKNTFEGDWVAQKMEEILAKVENNFEE